MYATPELMGTLGFDDGRHLERPTANSAAQAHFCHQTGHCAARDPNILAP
jgi:hypothetical protein